MKRIGTLYLSSEHFLDEANETIGAPAVGQNMIDIIQNRRNVTARASDLGKLVKVKVKLFFKETFGLDVKLQWDRKAGCTVCPCSPGFKISVPNDQLNKLNVWETLSEKRQNRIVIWGKDENLDVRYAKYDPFKKPQVMIDEEVRQNLIQGAVT
jgi:hypothetical protein